MTKLNKLFVYGTLKMELEDTHYILANMWNVGAYPCIILDKAERSVVRGQILDVTDEDLQKLDRYEGVPYLYARRRVIAFPLNDSFSCRLMGLMGNEVYVYEWAGKTDGLEHINEWDN